MICKLCIFQTIGKLGSNHIWRSFWFLHWQKLHYQPLATLLNVFLLVCKLSKSGLHIINLLHFENVKIDKHCLYLKVFNTAYIERFTSKVWCFFSYICMLVNCMSWVSKFSNFFLTCWETEARFIFEGFNIVPYGKFISDFAVLFLLFYLVCKLFNGLFQTLCQSVNFISWVFES